MNQPLPQPIKADGHQVQVVRHPNDAGLCRLMANGRTIALTYEQVQEMTTNSGTQRSVIRPKEPVEWAPVPELYAPCLRGELVAQSARRGEQYALHLFIGHDSGAVYNTVVYSNWSLLLVFDRAMTTCDISRRYAVDVST